MRLSVLTLSFLCFIVCKGQGEIQHNGLHFTIQEDSTLVLVSADVGVYCDSLIIPDSVSGHAVTAIGDNCFKDHTNLCAVQIPMNLKTIGNYAFRNTMLERLNIPSNVAQIGLGAFLKTPLKCLVIEDSDDPLQVDIENASTFTLDAEMSPFHGCPILDIYLGRNIHSNYRQYIRHNGWITVDVDGDLNAIYPSGSPFYSDYFRIPRVIFGEKIDTVCVGGFTVYKGFVHNPNMVVMRDKQVVNDYFNHRYQINENIVEVDDVMYLVNNDDFTCAIIDYPSYSNPSTSIVIPGEIEHNGYVYTPKTVGAMAFIKCELLQEVTLPPGITKIGSSAFSDCLNLHTIDTQGGIVVIGNQAFWNCPALEIFNGFDSVEQIGEQAFFQDEKFFPDALPRDIKEIGSESFFGSGVRTIRITPQLKLSDVAFTNCRFHQLFIEEGVTTVPYYLSSEELHTVSLSKTVDFCYGFQSCKNLRTIYSHNPIPPTFYTSSPFPSSVYKYAKLYIPEGALDMYKLANGWKNFLNVQSAITEVESDEVIIEAGDGTISVWGVDPSCQMAIYSIDGRIAYQGPVRPVGQLAQGVYVVQVNSIRRKIFLY